MLFSNATRGLSDFMKRHMPYPPLRPLIGGAVVATAVWAIETHRYIGLGLPVIVESFVHLLPWWVFLGKATFTVTSLDAGFKGGEVTPLFYIGATLGNALAPLLHLPFSPRLDLSRSSRTPPTSRSRQRYGDRIVRFGNRSLYGNCMRRELSFLRPHRHLSRPVRRSRKTSPAYPLSDKTR